MAIGDLSFAQGGQPVILTDDSANVIGVAAAPVRTDPTGSTTQPISASALPLPAGASTSALQTTGNSSLSSIDGKIGGILSLGDQKIYTSATPQISTYTASGKHFSYCAVNFNLATSGANNPILLITNPNASGKTYLMEEVVYFGRGTTSRQIIFQWISAPTITANGTAVTPFNRNVGGAASAMNVFTGPTLTLPSGTIFHETMHYSNSIQPLYEKWEQDFILGANRSIALVGIPSGLNTTVTVIVQWVEV